jgi:hypothetical protein
MHSVEPVIERSARSLSGKRFVAVGVAEAWIKPGAQGVRITHNHSELFREARHCYLRS